MLMKSSLLLSSIRKEHKSIWGIVPMKMDFLFIKETF